MTVATGTTGVTLAKPPGLADGNLLVSVLISDLIGSTGFSAPSGWFRLAPDQNYAFGFGEYMVGSLYGKYASGEPPSWSFGVSGSSPTSWGGVLAVFDDGGASVDFDGAGSNNGIGTSFAVSTLTPSTGADAWELVMAYWVLHGGPFALPGLGSPLAYSGSISSITAGGSIYPVQRGAATAGVANASGSAGWMGFTAAFKTTVPTGQRVMLRGISVAHNSPNTTVPVPSSVVTGDLMISFLHGSFLVLPSGWSTIMTQDSAHYAAMGRNAAGEPASYTFTGAVRASIAVFFDMDGATLGVDGGVGDGLSPSVSSYVGPSLVTTVANDVVVCDFSTQVGAVALNGPVGSLDAGGVSIDYATQSLGLSLVSFFVQPNPSATSGRNAVANGAVNWYGAQVAIKGMGLPLPVGPDLFPMLPGLSWSLMKSPQAGQTVIQRSVSGKERRLSLRSAGNPIWTYTLTYEVLRAAKGLGINVLGRYGYSGQVMRPASLYDSGALTENEWAVLAGFFLRQNGAGREWLYDDWNDNTVGLYQFGQGEPNGRYLWQTTFNAAWQAQFPSAPLLFWDQTPYGLRSLGTFAGIPVAQGFLDTNGLISVTPAPALARPLYITSMTATQSGQPLLGEQFGLGDGHTTQFQLARMFGGVRDGVPVPIKDLNGTPKIWVNGVVPVPAPVVDGNGMVTFSSAPALNAVLSWSGKYYYRMRFLNDSDEFEEFAYNLYAAKKIEAVSVLR